MHRPAPLQTKNYLAPNVNSAEFEKPWLGPIRILFRVEVGSGPSNYLPVACRKDEIDVEKAA